MKNKIIYGLLLAAFVTMGTAFCLIDKNPISSESQSGLCLTENTTFLGGEELVYKVYYSLPPMKLSAGEVKFKVKDNGTTYTITAEGRTYKSYEWFFKVRDNYVTVIDKKSLLPTYALRDIEEGGYKLYDELKFNQKDKTILNHRGKTKETANNHNYMAKDCIHDVLSVIYYTRNQNFNGMQPGSKFPIYIFMDKEEYALDVKYVKKQSDVKIPGFGRFNTVMISPELIEGDVFKEKNAMKIWATDDANRLPLMIETPLSLGSIKVVLQSHKGLKHALTSEN